MATSVFPTNTIPTLSAGGRVSGSAMVPRSAQNISTPNLTSMVFLNGLGDNQTNLAPLIRASNRRWGDIDLFTVHAGNAMMISDVLVYKLAATTGVSGLTGVLAPKVQIPNNVNTFKGRQYTYNVIPATNVPKRGTVRMMTKSVKEFQASMKQSGIGSHIEGGAYRSPEGAVFLEQELQAFGLSIEMNIALNTAQRAVQTATAKPFFVQSKALNALSFAKNIARELDTFCCGTGTSGGFGSAISNTLLTIPNASIIYMPLALSQNLVLNDKGAPRAFENQSVSMIESDGTRRTALLTNGSTQSLYTIFNQRLAVMEMPTFTFEEGVDIYQPLQHAMTSGSFLTLNADRGLKSWYDIDPSNPSDRSTQKFHPDNLSAYLYDHSKDARAEVTFSNAMQYCNIFNQSPKADAYHTKWEDRENAYSSNLTAYVGTFNDAYFAQSSASSSSSAVNWSALRNCISEYDKGMSDPDEGPYKLLQDIPFYEVTTKRGANKTAKRDMKGIFQTFKRNVQFPLTTRYSAEDGKIDSNLIRKGESNDSLRFCLPNCIGDLDPAHLPSNLFKTLVNDVSAILGQERILTCPEYGAYRALRSRLTEVPFDLHFWGSLWQKNITRIQGENVNISDALGNHKKARKEIADFQTSIKNSVVIPSLSWPRIASSDLLAIPNQAEYENYRKVHGLDKNTFENAREFLPQGLWSVQGLKLLSGSSEVGIGNLSRMATDALKFLDCLWKNLTKIMPYTIFESCGKAEFMAYFGNLGARFSSSSGTPNSANLNENDCFQAIMNILDSDYELYQVLMSTEGLVRDNRNHFEAAYGKRDAISNFAFLADPSVVDIVVTNTTPTSKDLRVTLVSKNRAYTLSLEGTSLDPELVAKTIDGLAVTNPQIKNTESYMKELKRNISHSSAEDSQDLLSTAPKSTEDTITNDQWVDIYALLGNLIIILSDIHIQMLNNKQALFDDKEDFYLFALDSASKNVTTATLPTNSQVRDIITALTVSLNSMPAFLTDRIEIQMTITTNGPDDATPGGRSQNIAKMRMTGLVLSYKQLPLDSSGNVDYTRVPGNIQFLTNFGSTASQINAKATTVTQKSHVHVYRDLQAQFQKYGRINSIFSNFAIGGAGLNNGNDENIVCHTHWFEGRMHTFVNPPKDGNPGAQKDWNPIQRLISAFICHSQLTYHQTLAGITSNGLRPVFEIACFRLFEKGIFNAVLLADPGVKTMFNPWNNPHIGMSRDGITDQYAIRAVVETDTVVIQPANLEIIFGVMPCAYCGGRNNKFIIDSANMLTYEDDDVDAPSIIACAVSYGYMSTTKQPISFINNPPGNTSNGIVGDVQPEQMWPGAHYYARTDLFDNMFTKSATSWNYDPTKFGKDTQAAQFAFTHWLEESSLHNHVAFQANVRVYDPYQETFSQVIPGTGHYRRDWMNEPGARDVFEGRASTPITPIRPAPTNYF